MKHIVIVGNGISGITAARNIRKQSDHRITVISEETDHFFSRTALMYVYMGHMSFKDTQPYEDWFWAKNKIDLVKDYVEKIDFDHKNLQLKQKGEMPYDTLILALGSESNKFGWPGQDLKGVAGLYSYQDLQYIEGHTKGISRGVIVGGGLIGIELAEMLHSRNIPVTFLVREKDFWNIVMPKEEAQMLNREIRDNHIDLRLSTELKEIIADENGRAKAVITNHGEEIPCEFVGLTAGVHPNLKLVQDTPLETQKGILVNEYLETNIPDVYAIGDCAQAREPVNGRRAIEAVWYVGRMMGETVASTVCGQKTVYQPGPWFNSAKFFDIEYQTYGQVSAELANHCEEFYWEHESGKKCVHFIYRKDTSEFIGMNTLGVRMRHEVFNQWLEDKKDIYYVMQHLPEANFDPEFFKRHEEEIISKFNSEHPERQVKAEIKKSLFQKIFA